MDLSFEKFLVFKQMVFSCFRHKQWIHEACGECLVCKFDRFGTLEGVIEYLTQGVNTDIEEGGLFSMLIDYSVVCDCGAHKRIGQHRIQNVVLSTIQEDLVLADLIASDLYHVKDKNRPTAECKNHKSQCIYKILRDPLIYLINLTWEYKTLENLIRFIEAITEDIDLAVIYKSNKSIKKHLHGMILEGFSSVVYIDLIDGIIFHKDSIQNMPLRYLFFVMLQYSLFPIVLIYDNTPTQNWQQQVNEVKDVLNLYKSFLIGENLNTGSDCFYCWNQAHETCSQTDYTEEWKCKDCKIINPAYTIFCLKCDLGRKKSGPNFFDTCVVCTNPTESTYCKVCSTQAHCSKCAKGVLKTQPFRCPNCDSWISSLYCKNCKTNVNKKEIICTRCNPDILDGISLCRHENLKRNCLECLYGFYCAVCFKSKLVYDPMLCWECSGEIVDGVCFRCERIICLDSIVCWDCKYSPKACVNNHKVTRQSIEVFECCKKNSSELCECCGSLCDDLCLTRAFCLECDRDITSNPYNKCYKCKINLEYNTCQDCGTGALCDYCFSYLFKCPCGSYLLTSDKNCYSCLESPPENCFPKSFTQKNQGWDCKKCNFSNTNDCYFCENCNGCKDSNKLLADSKSFNNKNKIANCSDCSKKILITQGVFCVDCGTKTMGRVCKTCKIIVNKDDIICFLCSLGIWKCKCGGRNKGLDVVCKRCRNPKLNACDICSSTFDVYKQCWRCDYNCNHTSVGDIIICDNCKSTSGLHKCTCGAYVLSIDSCCRICGVN